uniref:Uncharacterized protein n=1 Tax=Rhizophora mucronata TaxID=61149 RepID=A0A2P2J7Q8_RHIMU
MSGWVLTIAFACCLESTKPASSHLDISCHSAITEDY